MVTLLSARFSLLLPLFLLVGAVFSIPAEACSCFEDFEVSRVLAHSPAVFAGTVVSVERSRPGSTDDRIPVFMKTTVTFAVSEVFKGSLQEQVEIENGFDGQCAASLRDNTLYLVYATGQEGALRILHCTRTRLVSEAQEELKYLERLKLEEESTLLHGTVFSYSTDGDGNAVRHVPQPPLDLVVSGRRERFRVATAGGYQIEVPPGQYQVWVELDGLAVTRPLIITLNDGESRLLSLAPIW